MKRLFFACCLLAAFACTKDPIEHPGSGDDSQPEISGSAVLAAKGTIAVKLTPEAAAAVSSATRTGAEISTRSGVEGLDAVLSEIGATRIERIWKYNPEWESAYDKTGVNRWYAVYFDEEADQAAIGRKLSALPEVAEAEFPLDPKYRSVQVKRLPAGSVAERSEEQLPETRATRAMNDPLLKQQWHYDNAGPAGRFTNKVAGADINLTDAWEICQTGGSEIVVAVIDQPVYTEHPDLKANMWVNTIDPETNGQHGYNFWNRRAALDWKSLDSDGEYQDHGSHVAGVIAAVNNNGTGISSIGGGRNVKIMSCQIMGSASGGNPYAASQSFQYALEHGAVIAQNSWGYSTPNSSWLTSASYKHERDAIDTFVQLAGTKNANSPIQGGLVIFAAGNDGDTYQDAKFYPSAYSPVIAVSATDWSNKPAYYTCYGKWVDISAPGGCYVSGVVNGQLYEDACVLSTVLCDDSINYWDGRKSSSLYGYAFFQGTSMACPHVSGVAALGLAYASQLGKQFTAEEFTALLLSSVRGIEDYFTGVKDGSRLFQGGRLIQMADYKDKMGGGLLDATKLLLAVEGTPAFYVETGTTSTFDFGEYFGDEKSKIQLLSVSADDISKIGLSSAPQLDGSSVTLSPTKAGVLQLTITAKAGDLEYARKFAIVSRPGMADNGGWL